MSDQTWAGVRERVRALARAAGSDRVFGFSGHRFVLEEPLAPWQVAELEAHIGTGLPEEYRGFLLEVGAGGAGPGYGLFPVRRADGRWRWEGDGADLADPSRLAEPFPVQGPDPALVKALLAQCPREEDFDPVEDFDDAMAAWDERWARLMWSPERTVGAVVVCHLGCASRQWLVVSGPERGRIWSDDRVDDEDLAPLLDGGGGPLTFARWYLDWLGRAEEQVASQTKAAEG